LPLEGQFYKANLHSHTRFSDGALSPEEMKQAYQQQGYAIVANTDHWYYGWHPALVDLTFLPIAGFEFGLNQKRADCVGFTFLKTWHINFYDTRPTQRQGYTPEKPDFAYEDTDALNAYIARMNADGFLACYNHPGWSLQTYEDYTRLRGLFAMEVYNYNCDQERAFGYEAYAYDDMLRSGSRLHCVSTDDNHNDEAMFSPKSDSFGGYTVFKLPELTYDALFAAMRAGAFYCSSGPEIKQLYVKDNRIHIETSPADTICFSSAGRRCGMWRAPRDAGTLTEASYDIVGDERFIRATVVDAQGRRAYTNAVYL